MNYHTYFVKFGISGVIVISARNETQARNRAIGLLGCHGPKMKDLQVTRVAPGTGVVVA